MKVFLISFVLMCGAMLTSCDNIAKNAEQVDSIEIEQVDSIKIDPTIVEVIDTLSVDTLTVDSIQ